MNDTTIILGSSLFLQTQHCIGKASWTTDSQYELTDLTISPTTSGEYVVKSTLKGCPDAYDTVKVTVLNFYGSRAEGEISIHPNPSKANIEVRANQSLSSIEVIDNYGRTLLISELSGDTFHTVNLAKLPSGVYYVKVVTEDQYLHIKKIIKE